MSSAFFKFQNIFLFTLNGYINRYLMLLMYMEKFFSWFGVVLMLGKDFLTLWLILYLARLPKLKALRMKMKMLKENLNLTLAMELTLKTIDGHK